ncbi:MAG: tol-pal system-associated acyl-CoA thioesterase [Gammaproteobacteria bacterium]|jgi:acyl-CoA thioester hydrolase|nr:tol-pal system-associated acyl-CoA thioesterase [Gammaproteobacteria bacterium]
MTSPDQRGSIHSVRVYYEDTDHGGVVYHANYLRFMERARTEMLRDCGFELDRLEQDDGVIFAVRRASLDFIAPARFNDLLRVETEMIAKGPVRMTFAQKIYHQERLLCRGEVEVVCLEASRFRPTAIPARLAAVIPVPPLP